MSSRLKRVSCDDGVELALKLFEANGVTLARGGDLENRSRPTLPILMGAGVSVSSGVPLNALLLETVSRKLSSEIRDYAGLYELLNQPLFGDYKQDSYMKPKLRRWLVESGIPRLADRPLPNLSNLLITHLMANNLIGPVISLNVDPLLSSASLFFEDKTLQARTFIQNASQFSDLLGHGYIRNDMVFQPHGTIEEPLSLRFAERELISENSENALRDVLVNALRERVGLLSIGVNFVDGVAFRLVSEWVSNNPETELHFLTTAYNKIHSEELDKLEELAGQHENLSISIAEGADSDYFWEKLTHRAVQKTWEHRANNETLYHVPPASEIQLQLNICRALSDKLLPKGTPYRKLPDELRWLILHICIHAIISRGPFKLRDLVRSASTKRAFRYLFESPRSIKTFSNAVQKVLASGLLSVAERSDSMLGEIDLRKYRSFEDIGSILLVRGEKYKTPTKFAEKMFELLDLRKGDAHQIVEIIKRIELDRESYFDKQEAIPAHLFFDDSEILGSHFDLDYQLDQLKGLFAKAVETGEKVRGLVITERGEHLFKNTVLEGLASFDQYQSSSLSLAESVRSWIGPVLSDNAQEGQSLSIIIADQPTDWVFDHGDRSERDKIIKDLVERLDQIHNIDVRVLPWDKHDDHMWVLETENRGNSAGVLFPRPHGQQSYFGLYVQGEQEVNKLVGVFERHFRDARPISHDEINHVMALTIVDKSGDPDARGVSLDDKILVGVRSADTNSQHSNIACVPTMRIPPAIFEEIASYGNRISGEGAKSQILDADWTENGRGTGHNAVDYGVQNIMSRKLGLAEAHELGDISYLSTPRVLKSDYSPKFSDQDVDEYLAMLNVLVFLVDGKGSIPQKTASYSRLEWVKVSDFLDALKEHGDRGNLLLGQDDEKTPFLCGGVCVCTSEVLLSEIAGLAS